MIFKKIFIFLIIIIAILILFIISMMTLTFFTSKPIEIINYKPTKFDVLIDRPILIYFKDVLYYSRSGNIKDLTNPIRYGKFRKIFVSPDSEYLLILVNRKLTLLNNMGVVLDFISPSMSEFDEDKPKEQEYFIADNIQWSPDSKSFFIIKMTERKKKDHNLKVDLYEKDLYQYRIINKSLIKQMSSFDSDNLFFSPNGRTIFYSKYSNELDGYQLVSYDLISKKKNLVKDYNKFLSKDKKNYYFINFNSREIMPRFGDSYNVISYDGSVSVEARGSKLFGVKSKASQWGGVFVCKNKSDQEIIRSKDGYNSLYHNFFNLNLNGAHFFPGNRYFLFWIENKVFNGQLIVDTLTNKYMEFSKSNQRYDYYFSITSKDVLFRPVNQNGPLGPFDMRKE